MLIEKKTPWCWTVQSSSKKKGDGRADPSRPSGQSPISLLSGSRPCSFWPLFCAVCVRRGLMAVPQYIICRRRKAAHVHRASPPARSHSIAPHHHRRYTVRSSTMILSIFVCFFLLLLLLLLLLLMRSIDHCPMALQLLAPFFFPPFLFLGCFLFSDGIMRSWLLDAGCCFDSAASQFPSVFTRRTEMLGI